MKKLRLYCPPLLALVCAGRVWSQMSGLTQRVPNTTLRMPASPPVYGYATADAFTNLTFLNPVAIVSPPGETNRLFVVDQSGLIEAITNLSIPTKSLFLNIGARIAGGTPPDERGLLGLAFHPRFSVNGYFYVFYTARSPTNSAYYERVSRFQLSSGNPNQADTNSEVILINQLDPAVNHNGGDLHFGPDGYLYVSLGDGGNQNDSLGNAQHIDKGFFSGILRIDVDKLPGNLEPNSHVSVITNLSGLANYSVPADNPFIGATNFNGNTLDTAKVRTEFWAVGLRNPWRFSFDPLTGRLYCGDVGQDTYEEVDVIVKGGNYGWSYREGLHAGPRTAPAGFISLNPIQEYRHGSGTNQGNSVTGGVVYRGNRVSQLFGAYVFADYVSGNIWALRYDGTNTGSFVRLTGRTGVSAFGIDPSTGDVLLADQNTDTIRRLVYATNVVSGSSLPPTLADTGAFLNLTSLQPNPGIVPYDINVPFWSDNARKTRWFTVPATNLTIGFNPQGNWLFPTGTVWIKHFELELTNGAPESARRLETRFIVRNTDGIYGVTYRWDSPTNATLVPEEGMDDPILTSEGGTERTQVWHYPSRSECLSCHTTAGGLALGFNTPQMNRSVDYGNGLENQMLALNRVGYFSSPLTNINTLAARAHPTNTAYSLDYRVHSYLAANCAQCHQPGGTALGYWDARITTPLSQAAIINGLLRNDRGDTDSRVIRPGAPDHSMMLTRISLPGSGRMPPLDSSVLDTNAINLLSGWITVNLPGYQSLTDWQTAHFGDAQAPGAAPEADPDGDGANNLLEYLTGTDPMSDAEAWKISVRLAGATVEISYPQIANRGFQVEWSADLTQPGSWRPLDVPGNRPFFPATNSTSIVTDVITSTPFRLYRVRVFEP